MKNLIIVILLLVTSVSSSQQNFYIFDMTDFLSDMEKDWSIGNGIDIYTGEFVGAYFEVTVENGMNMNGYNLEIMNSTIRVYGDSINSGQVTKRFESSNLYFAPLLSTVEEQYKPLEIKMFPNPASDFVIFMGDYVDRLVIYDINKRLVKREQPKSKNFRINTNTMSSGIYIVQIFSNNNKGIFKKLIIKQWNKQTGTHN